MLQRSNPVRSRAKSKASNANKKAILESGNASWTQAYNFKEQVGHLLRRNYQRHLAIFQALACDKQLTSVQFVTLCAIYDYGPSSQVDLVNSTNIDQATIRGIINRLKARKLITLSADHSDKRKVVASLTDQGQRLLEQMVPCAQDITIQTISPLNPAEREALLFLLRKLLSVETGSI